MRLEKRLVLYFVSSFTTLVLLLGSPPPCLLLSPFLGFFSKCPITPTYSSCLHIGCDHMRENVDISFEFGWPSLIYILSPPYSCKSHAFIFLYSWTVFHLVCRHFHYWFFYWGTSRLFYFLAIVNKHRYANTFVVGYGILWVYV